MKPCRWSVPRPDSTGWGISSFAIVGNDDRRSDFGQRIWRTNARIESKYNRYKRADARSPRWRADLPDVFVVARYGYPPRSARTFRAPRDHIRNSSLVPRMILGLYTDVFIIYCEPIPEMGTHKHTYKHTNGATVYIDTRRVSIGTIIILGCFRWVSKTDSQLPVMIKCGFRNPSSSIVIIILGCFRWVSKTHSQLPVMI